VEEDWTRIQSWHHESSCAGFQPEVSLLQEPSVGTASRCVMVNTDLATFSAFEIVEVHKREPPPKEILEDVSAKGADLLHRTLENFHRGIGRDEPMVNGVDHDGSEDDGQGTPRGDRMDLDEPGSGGARAARGRHSSRLLRF